MKSNLTNEILFHVYSNLGLGVESNFALNSNKFLLSESIILTDEETEYKLPLWGAELIISGDKFQLLATEISENNINKEFVLLAKLENCPAYGCFLCVEHTVFDIAPCRGKLMFSLKENSWLQTNTYLQANFLAGMEQLKEVLSAWEPIKEPDQLIESIKSLLENILDEG